MRLKLLCERFTSSIYGHTANEEVLAWHMLKRPSVNHSDIFSPMVERFIFNQDQLRPHWERLCESDIDGRQGLRSAEENLRLPLDVCWFEVVGSLGAVGYLVSAVPGDHEIRCFSDVDGAPRFTWAVRASAIRSSGTLSMAIALPPPHEPELVKEINVQVGVFALLCAILAAPNMATTERVVRAMGATKESRAYHRARAQRGKPVFSFNKVTVNLPQTAHLNGVLIDRDSPLVKRAHMVIGHWRLIDSVLDPYWVWVQPHERGDRAAGYVANERHVCLSADLLRRGWLMPSSPGTPGKRIAALRAA